MRVIEQHVVNGTVGLRLALEAAMQRYALTPREREVFRIILEDPDLTYAQIAERMFVSNSTVKQHMNRALGRIGTRNSSREAMVRLLAVGLSLRARETEVARHGHG